MRSVRSENGGVAVRCVIWTFLALALVGYTMTGVFSDSFTRWDDKRSTVSLVVTMVSFGAFLLSALALALWKGL